MAEIPFVDTHFHLHDLKRPELRYSWLERDAVHPFLGDIDAIKPVHYWIDDYLAEIRFSNVPKAIHVQAALGIPDPVKETEWLQGIADRAGYPHAIVAECHLARPDAEQVLERHMAFANVRGIRDLADADYLLDPAWQSGWRKLETFGLVSCLDTRVWRAPQVVRLAALAPRIPICIDHCAIPMERTPESFKLWQAAMRTLAGAENVWMKISGLGMFDRRWTIESLRPYVLGAIEAFGPARVVFGTNWPVDRMFSSYPDLIDAYAAIIAGFSEAEQCAMFGANAERLFRI